MRTIKYTNDKILLTDRITKRLQNADVSIYQIDVGVGHTEYWGFCSVDRALGIDVEGSCAVVVTGAPEDFSLPPTETTVSFELTKKKQAPTIRQLVVHWEPYYYEDVGTLGVRVTYRAVKGDLL